MITAVTLNAAIDKTYVMKSFHRNRANRVEKCFIEPGGKGTNAAKVLHALGADITASGFAGGRNGELMKQLLDEKGIPHSFSPLPGETRTCLSIVTEAEENEQTELLESGPSADEESWEACKKMLAALFAKSEFAALSGSLPGNLAPESYAELVVLAKAHGCKAVLDAGGAALALGIAAGPYMIKPNLHEYLEYVQEKTFELEKFRFFSSTLHEKGTSYVCVTLGKMGAVLSFNGSLYQIGALDIRAKSAVGSGDAFLAGFLFALSRNEDPLACLRHASAAAAANALEYTAGTVNRKTFQTLLQEAVCK
ncbi:hexose kinase [Metabacillus sp. GX 13764]|uniref:1-phosphofructokinase family hexose kinase n=1 Tax=Metabacillus kandeliae TaxID=2900151 RepID=UPI001E2D9A93|nr:hexose kinase [Metabacillus kandeliae]